MADLHSSSAMNGGKLDSATEQFQRKYHKITPCALGELYHLYNE